MKFILHSSFDKDYRKLPTELQYKADEKLKLFDGNHLDPILDDHPLQGKYADCRSINITGDFRAIYYINANVAVFIRIGTHSQLYGK